MEVDIIIIAIFPENLLPRSLVTLVLPSETVPSVKNW